MASRYYLPRHAPRRPRGLTVLGALAPMLFVGAFLGGGDVQRWGAPAPPIADSGVAAAADTSTLEFAPEADARVSESSPSGNYGTSTALRTDGGSDPDVESYLRFEVSGTEGVVQAAKLRLYAYSGTADGPAVYGAGNEWSETGVAWGNRPARTSTRIYDRGSIPSNTWVEWDVTALVDGEGTYTVVLDSTSSDGADFRSREHSSSPQLVVTMKSAAEPPEAPTPTPTPATAAHPILAAAGDIATCAGDGDEETAALLAGASAIATLGDNVYQSGTVREFADCYAPSWGRYKAITRPAAGNHDYYTSDGKGYFGYFGDAAGEPDEGYYSYDLGSWHVVVLNSNCTEVGGCGAGSRQERWLREDLEDNPSACTLAYWHHARFSSGKHGNYTAVSPLWRALYEHGADVVLSGHDHHYERFAPQDPDADRDDEHGIRQFVVGTGGGSHYSISTVRRNSELRNATTFGVLRLTLRAGAYDWRFTPESGRTFSDAGSDSCVSAP